MQVEKKYYNPCRLALSGREYKVLRSYKDGRKKIQFDDFFGEIEEVHRCLQAKLIESPRMSLQDSIDCIDMIEKIRQRFQKDA